jgi:hypothetical protein
VPTHPDQVRRRIPPDEIQLQVILGCLLGDATLVGPAGSRRMRVVHAGERAPYAAWKLARLGPLVADPLAAEGDRVWFETVAHPLFDDLAPFFYVGAVKRVRREAVLERLAPLGLAVWMSDLGRSRIAPDLLLPSQAALLVAT